MKKTLFFIVCIILAAGAALFSEAGKNSLRTVSAASYPTVILDAGHGGEDGGCVAADGTVEKDINLQLSEAIALYFDLFGIPYRTVREDDSLIGDNTLPTVRERKSSDLHARMDLVTETQGSVLLSIHQNYFISEKYSGTQVFYAENAPGSREFAEMIQSAVVRGLQQGNTRQVKPTEGTVFLLDKATHTSVMVECGFLSNLAELRLLKTTKYRAQMAYFITCGVCEFFNNHNIST